MRRALFSSLENVFRNYLGIGQIIIQIVIVSDIKQGTMANAPMAKMNQLDNVEKEVRSLNIYG